MLYYIYSGTKSDFLPILERIFMKNVLVESCQYNPYYNLALEECLASLGRPVFYLWQNKKTVVIGNHQNAFAECKWEQLEEEGGFLARRKTGGGAVFHDLGNLNFTFCMPIHQYDVQKQLSVLLHALQKFGLTAEFSGRNDLLLQGKKFSGNAFKCTKTCGIHHGTIMLNVELDALNRYLQVPKAKMEAKGIQSFRQRVCNLQEINPNITVPALKAALFESFISLYGESEIWQPQDFPCDLQPLIDFYESFEWRIGTSPHCNVSFLQRIEEGTLQFHLFIEKGTIQQIVIHADLLDVDFVTDLEKALRGVPYTFQAVCNALHALPYPDSRVTPVIQIFEENIK